jgi:SAM-dependent methyltransferase
VDFSAELIRKHAVGKSFADIGCMWGVNGFFSFLAEECGAKRVVAVDIYPESEEFLREKSKRNSAVEFVQGDIHLQEIISKIGLCDVVFCSGVLYHSPNPLDTLSKLRLICNQKLILSTALIPEMPGIRNGAIFYPFLDEKQRDIWNQDKGEKIAITVPYEPKMGYANWFWGFSPSCVEAMLECAGYKVEERYITPFIGYFVCRTATAKLLPVSGDWTTPNDEDFLKFKH